MRRRDVWPILVFGARQSLPFLVSFGLIFFGLFPFRIPFLIELFAPLVYISLFCWIILRPDLLPPVSVFVLGILSDLMYANPLGLDTFMYLLFYTGIYTQRRFLIGHSFFFLWGTFAVFMVPIFLIQWGLVSLLRQTWMPLGLMVGQCIMTVALYPVIAGLCSKIYNTYLDEDL